MNGRFFLDTNILVYSVDNTPVDKTQRAKELVREFEQWLEPRLADNHELADLAGWPTKLAGACLRISAVLHCFRQIGQDPPASTAEVEVGGEIVANAVRLCRDYLLPHARAALGLLGANPLYATAQGVVHALTSLSCRTISRRDLHRKCGRRVKCVKEVDPVIELLVQCGYLRQNEAVHFTRRNTRSQEFEINPRLRRN